MNEATLALAKESAAALWKAEAKDVSVVDVATAFPWFKKNATVMAVHRDMRRVLFSIDKEGTVRAVVGNTPEERLAQWNGLLAAEGLEPEKLAPESLAVTCRAFLKEPGGWVGSPKFLENQKTSLAMWTSPNPDKGPELFERHCQEPQWQIEGDQWVLRFFYFNRNGGVEEWVIKGENGKVQSADHKSALADGTFLCPYG